MPTSVEIENIAASFGKQYGIDIPKIRKDTEKLLEIINRNDKIGDLRTLFANSITCEPAAACAIIPDLETFDINEVALDPRLFVSRVEQNLDESARYTEICLQIRRQYGEMAKARNDVRFKFEEFLQLDLIHQEEVKAGLYELPLSQATADYNALRKAIKALKCQDEEIEKLFNETNPAGKLSKIEEEAFLKSSAFIARAHARDNMDLLAAESNTVTKYRTTLDHATWTQSKLATKGSLAQQYARLEAAKEKVEYLKKDVVFRIHRAVISRNLAWLQVDEHARPNSVINFNDRLENIKTLFETNLKFLVQRVRSLRDGLKSYYGIDMPFDANRGEILDKIAVWLTCVQDELSKDRRAQRLVVCSQSITLRTDTESDESAFEVEFAFSATSMPAGRPLLRGVAFELIGTYNRPVALHVIAPQDASPFCNSPVLFGRVGAFTPGLDLKAQHSDLFWNGSPSGLWKIKGSLDKGCGTIDTIIMHLWLSLE